MPMMQELLDPFPNPSKLGAKKRTSKKKAPISSVDDYWHSFGFEDTELNWSWDQAAEEPRKEISRRKKVATNASAEGVKYTILSRPKNEGPRRAVTSPKKAIATWPLSSESGPKAAETDDGVPASQDDLKTGEDDHEPSMAGSLWSDVVKSSLQTGADTAKRKPKGPSPSVFVLSDGTAMKSWSCAVKMDAQEVRKDSKPTNPPATIVSPVASLEAYHAAKAFLKQEKEQSARRVSGSEGQSDFQRRNDSSCEVMCRRKEPVSPPLITASFHSSNRLPQGKPTWSHVAQNIQRSSSDAGESQHIVQGYVRDLSSVHCSQDASPTSWVTSELPECLTDQCNSAPAPAIWKQRPKFAVEYPNQMVQSPPPEPLLARIPLELRHVILGQLSATDLGRLCRVSWRMFNLVRHDQGFWRQRLLHDFPTGPRGFCGTYHEAYKLHTTFAFPRCRMVKLSDLTQPVTHLRCLDDPIKKLVMVGDDYQVPCMLVLLASGKLCELPCWTSTSQHARDLRRDLVDVETPASEIIEIQGGWTVVALAKNGDLWATYRGHTFEKKNNIQLHWTKISSGVSSFVASGSRKQEIAVIHSHDLATIKYYMLPKLGCDGSYLQLRSVQIPQRVVDMCWLPDRILCITAGKELYAILTREKRDDLVSQRLTPKLWFLTSAVIKLEETAILVVGKFGAVLLDGISQRRRSVVIETGDRKFLPFFRSDIVYHMKSGQRSRNYLLFATDLTLWQLQLHSQTPKRPACTRLFKPRNLPQNLRFLKRNFVHGVGRARQGHDCYEYVLYSELSKLRGNPVFSGANGVL